MEDYRTFRYTYKKQKTLTNQGFKKREKELAFLDDCCPLHGSLAFVTTHPILAFLDDLPMREECILSGVTTHPILAFLDDSRTEASGISE